MKRNCNNCGKEYTADKRNLKRGWGLCCSKSCAAHKREKSKPGYDPERVKRNNAARGDYDLRAKHYYEDTGRDFPNYYMGEFDYDSMEHPFSDEALGQD